MAEVLAVLGAVQSAAAIVDCIKICRETYCYISKIVRSIKEMGADVADLEQRYKEEESRMWTFALAHNLVVDQKHQIDARYLENLPPYWVSVVDARFALVANHLEEARKLVAHYIDDQPFLLEAAEKPPLEGGGATSQYLPQRSPMESPSIISAKSMSDSRAMSLQKLSFQLKVSWAHHGKKKLETSVEKLERDNNILWNLTAPNILNSMIDAVSSRISRADMQILAARNVRVVNNDEFLKGRQIFQQRVKEQGEAQDCIARLGQETPDQKLARLLDASCFQEILHATLPDHRTRTPTTCCLDGNELGALVEWKEWDESLITRADVIARVSDIAAILKNPPSALHNVLSCPGFFEDNRSNSRGTKWIGIAYDTTKLGYLPKVRTLRDLLTRPKEKYKEFWTPALGDRFGLAYELAKTLLAIHNCDWLHKGLRPENVVFFSSEKSIKEPYLLGWDYSRSAKEGQQTEQVMAWSTDAELYQHPRYFDSTADDGEQKPRFRVEFDHYQLGCLLLEIGLWLRIGDLKKTTSQKKFSGDDWRDVWKEYLEKKAEKLEAEMGHIYSQVVLKLLRGLEGDGIDYWDNVILRLGQCQA